MKEQVISARGNRKSPVRARTSEVMQNPARRGKTLAGGRIWSAVVPGKLVSISLLALGAAVLLVTFYRLALSSGIFQLQYVQVQGAERTQIEEVKSVVRQSTGSKGVWNADLGRIRGELFTHLPWVRRVVVSRVLPSGLRVLLSERRPEAVMRTLSGSLVWVDADGALLGEISPGDTLPPFFIRGLDETRSGSEANKQRIEEYLGVERDCEKQGVCGRVSELNLRDLDDVRAQLSGEDANVEIRLGGEDLGNRLQSALEALDKQQGTRLRPLVTYVDAASRTQNHRIIIGYNPRAPVMGVGEESLKSEAPSGTGHPGHQGQTAGVEVKHNKSARRG